MTELDWAQTEVDALCRELSDAIARAEKSGRLRATVVTFISGGPQTVRVEVRKRPDFELELRGIAP